MFTQKNSFTFRLSTKIQQKTSKAAKNSVSKQREIVLEFFQKNQLFAASSARILSAIFPFSPILGAHCALYCNFLFN